jgi:ketosteroid isomerase-like protein
VSNANFEQRLRALEDREEIRELSAKYAFYVATCNVSALVDLFVDDGHYHAVPHTTVGKAELREYLERRLRMGARVPMVENHIIVLNGDAAEADSTMFSPWGPDGPLCGTYRDTYRRTREGWRIVDRYWTAHPQPPPRQRN